MSRFPRSALQGQRIGRKDAIGRAEQGGQTEVDEIDAGYAEHHVAVSHHAFVEQTIQQIENRRFGWFEHPVCYEIGSPFAIVASRHQISP